MTLYLMRHGPAVERGTPGYEDDDARPLTPKGERVVREVAEGLAKMDVAVDGILTSPLTRAQGTADIVHQKLHTIHAPQPTRHLAPGGNPIELMKLIRSHAGNPASLLLVGHEPDLGKLTSLLLTGGDSLTAVFKKAGVARLLVESPIAGRCAALEWLMTARQLERMR